MSDEGQHGAGGADEPVDDAADNAGARAHDAGRAAWIGVLLALLSSVSYAGVNALLRAVAGDIDPFVGSLLRQLPLLTALAIGAIVLRPPALQPRNVAFIGRRTVMLLVGAGIISLFVGNALLFWSLEWVGLGVSTAGYLGGMMLGSAAISWAAMKERPTGMQFVGMAGIVVGLWFTAQSAARADGETWMAVLGFILAVITGICYAISNSASRAVQRRPGRFIATLGLLALSAVVALFVFLLIRDGFDLGRIFGSLTSFELWIVLLAGVVNGVALGSITLAVQFTTATAASMLNALVLPIGLVFGLVFFGEPITVPLTVGSVLILAGVVAGQVRMGRRRSA